MNKFYECFYNNDKTNIIRKDTGDNFCVHYDYKDTNVDIHTGLLLTVKQLVDKAKLVD